MPQSRKDFLKNLGLISVGTCCMGLEGCTPVRYVSGTFENKKLKVNILDFADKKFVLVKNSILPAPVYLCKLENENFSALLIQCTHKQCELNPLGNILVCPCHGSEFSNTGKVLKSPAEKDLMKFQVTTDEQNIYIHL